MWALSLLWALSLCWMLPGTLGDSSFIERINSVSYDACNTSGVVIPCLAPIFSDIYDRELQVYWRLNETEIISYNSLLYRIKRGTLFLSVDFLVKSVFILRDASIKIPLKEAIPGNYTCKIEAISDGLQPFEDESSVQVQSGSPFWFQPVESSLIIGAVIMGAAVFLLQVGFAEGYTIETQFGLRLVVLPAAILVPPLFFIFQSVFDKPPLFAIILIILKALGYLIAVAGMVASLSECPRKQASVVIAGLGIMDLVAVIAFTYMVGMGTRFKDHQPPKIAVGELRKAKK